MPETDDKKKLVAKALLSVIDKKAKITPEEIIQKIEIPPSQELGDFAFPCFFLSRQLKKDPKKIALEISEKFKEKKPGNFSEIKCNGPYVNFFLDRNDFATELISEIKKQKDKFGSDNIGKGKKVLVEHTSINPNASPHVGRARNAIIGDSIVRILRFEGFKPEVHYLVNDVSKQIAMLVLAGAEKKNFEEMLSEYVKIAAKVKKSKATEKKVFDLLYKF